jgi:hypothetical protein
MISDATKHPDPRGGSTGLVRNALRVIKGLKWLSTPDSLVSIGSRDFARSIESNLNLVAQGSVMRLQLRKRDTAVVMSMKHYEEMLQVKSLFAQLIERVKDIDIAEQTNEYEDLYQRISSSQSRKAADSLFGASGAGLRKTFKPGNTEST